MAQCALVGGRKDDRGRGGLRGPSGRGGRRPAVVGDEDPSRGGPGSSPGRGAWPAGAPPPPPRGWGQGGAPVTRSRLNGDTPKVDDLGREAPPPLRQLANSEAPQTR